MTRNVPILTRFILSCLAGAILFLAAPPAFAAEYVSVLKDGVNVRSGPDTNKEVLWELFKGFPLQVVSRKGKWAQVVDFEGDKGWVFAPLLAKEKTLVVKSDTVNMRVGPGLNYEIVATVKYGVVFTPLEKDGEWVKVQHEDGTSGWISAKLLWPN
ncbi:SH3 domain-containing protein [Thiovibrio sp. JS02]